MTVTKFAIWTVVCALLLAAVFAVGELDDQEVVQVSPNITSSEPPEGVDTAAEAVPTDTQNISDSNSSSTVAAQSDSVSNETKNDSKVTCLMRLENDTSINVVQMLNSSALLQVLVPVKNATVGECAVVFFFSPYCVFSARSAPYINAMTRAFHHVKFYAVDVVHWSHLNMRYGLVAVPSILLFHNGRAVAKFNDSSPSIDGFLNFVSKHTGMSPAQEIVLTEEDMAGPIPTEAKASTDWVLVSAWLFTILCIVSAFVRSTACQKMVDSVRNTWREAQHQHED